MDKSISRVVRQFVDRASQQQTGIISAFVFGSYAKNMQHTDSDIDVALVIDNLADTDRFDTQVRLMLLAAQIDSRIEPHPISKSDLISDNPFMVEILRTGIKLKLGQ